MSGRSERDKVYVKQVRLFCSIKILIDIQSDVRAEIPPLFFPAPLSRVNRAGVRQRARDFLGAYLGLVFRGGRWIRCVRQRAPRRGTVPQSRQGRAKPLRHEALLFLPMPPLPRRPLRPNRRIHLVAVPHDCHECARRAPPAVARRRGDRRNETRGPAGSTCCRLCPTSPSNHHIHHLTPPPPWRDLRPPQLLLFHPHASTASLSRSSSFRRLKARFGET